MLIGTSPTLISPVVHVTSEPDCGSFEACFMAAFIVDSVTLLIKKHQFIRSLVGLLTLQILRFLLQTFHLCCMYRTTSCSKFWDFQYLFSFNSYLKVKKHKCEFHSNFEFKAYKKMLTDKKSQKAYQF